MKNKIPLFLNRTVFAEQMIDKYFKNSPNHIISDIGAGFGYMEHKIISVGAIWQPFDYVKKMDFSIIWDLNEQAPINVSKAGMVIFLEVLEHLGNPLLGIQHIANHTEKGGILILTVPNPQSSKNRINLLMKGTLYAFQEKHLAEYHVFTPWEHIVKYFLEQAGFEIVEYAIVDTYYLNDKPKSIKGKIKYFLERIIEKFDPKAKGMSYGLVAKKL
ncbi:MAG: methyltransferase domain-containing protein [Flavobacteriaceae bacterium]|nr:methyltransferase domain-containing protein [Flavobacteriaceae bacterium]